MRLGEDDWLGGQVPGEGGRVQLLFSGEGLMEEKEFVGRGHSDLVFLREGFQETNP